MTSSSLSKILRLFLALAVIGGGEAAKAVASEEPHHTFSIGDKDFLIDGKAVVLRVAEMHFARVPHEYWRHRLQEIKAMGMNAVCAYLFWNYHEFEKGKYDWSGQADAAEFCRIAQEEGLWVILRPGPYVCAEWDGGGLPWWLLKNDKIQLRTQDPEFMKEATAWYQEVGRVLGPLQVTHGGPILMAQVENEYGSYGKDADYMGKLRQALVDAGFNIPLFACNPRGDLKNGARPDLFNVVNFGRDARGAFQKLRESQPNGPMMCGEFYPGWFDTWGSPHHLGNNQAYLDDLEFMLKNGYSFSLYMAHGGTTPGMYPGTDRPFKPDVNSYDYDAPISESGGLGAKYQATRDLILKYLPAGEKLPDPPAPISVTSIPSFKLIDRAPLLANLPASISDTLPRNMEAYDQGHGCMVYRTELPAGSAATLQVDQANDFAWVFLDGKQIGVLDRRAHLFSVNVPARANPAQLDILVESMGHVNFGREIHDRKGLRGSVKLVTSPTNSITLEGKWEIYPLRLDVLMISKLKWEPIAGQVLSGPAFWRGTFTVEKPADTFLDLRSWGKGVLWVNGHCLSRFWNIGPTQTAFLPGAWLKQGVNEITILDLLGPKEPSVEGLEKPILDLNRPELDFSRSHNSQGTLQLKDSDLALQGSFQLGADAQTVKLPRPVTGRQFCIQTLNAHDGKPFAAIAELDLLDPQGNSIPHQNWTIAYADSEELNGEDGSASNAIDGQTSNFWHTEWKAQQPNHPHYLIIDLGKNVAVGGFRYTPRAGNNVLGRIKDYRIYVGDTLVKK
jgi:beta-galactosidase